MSRNYPVLTRVRNRLHKLAVALNRFYYTRIWGVRMGEGARISLKARIDKTNPRAIEIGAYTMITFDARILSHDFVGNRHLPVKIGDYSFIGCGAIIMPGVSIGDHCIIGAGSVVTRDVPSRCIAVGNPARIVKEGVRTREWGILLDDTEQA